MAETPNPSLAELRDLDVLVNGDLGLAQDEIVRRLWMLLPAWIAEKNAQKGWSGADSIEVPRDIRIAPKVLTDEYLNTVLVGVSVETTPQGIGGMFRNEVRVTVSSVDARIEWDQQVRLAWARAEAIRTVLLPFLSGCRNADDELCWRMLEPTGYGLLPGEWAREYSGTAVTFKMIQSPRAQ
jgi:hypothetical protein